VEQSTVLIAGASGLVGQAAARHFASIPGWHVVTVSRRPPSVPVASEWLSLDLGWFAPDFAIEIGSKIKLHPRVSTTRGGTSNHDRFRAWNRPAGRRSKRFLTPLQKYEIFLQLVRQEVTMAEAAERWQVDRGVIMRIRTVAKEGALEALSNSRPGTKAKARDYELEAARADAVRLGEALKEMAVKLMLVEGKGRWG
jgi:transposase